MKTQVDREHTSSMDSGVISCFLPILLANCNCCFQGFCLTYNLASASSCWFLTFVTLVSFWGLEERGNPPLFLLAWCIELRWAPGPPVAGWVYLCCYKSSVFHALCLVWIGRALTSPALGRSSKCFGAELPWQGMVCWLFCTSFSICHGDVLAPHFTLVHYCRRRFHYKGSNVIFPSFLLCFPFLFFWWVCLCMYHSITV